MNFGIASINLIGRVLTGASLLAVPSPIAQNDASGRLRQCGVVVGADSLIKTITIMNVGELENTDDLTVVNTAAGAAGPSQRGGSHDVSGCAGSALTPNATCILALFVHPADAAAHAAVAAEKIALVTDATATTLMMGGNNVTVSWVGVAAAKLTPNPTKLVFDDTSAYPDPGILATTNHMDVTIANAAGAPATGPLSISTSVADFYIDPSTTNSTCLALAQPSMASPEAGPAQSGCSSARRPWPLRPRLEIWLLRPPTPRPSRFR